MVWFPQFFLANTSNEDLKIRGITHLSRENFDTLRKLRHNAFFCFFSNSSYYNSKENHSFLKHNKFPITLHHAQ